MKRLLNWVNVTFKLSAVLIIKHVYVSLGAVKRNDFQWVVRKSGYRRNQESENPEIGESGNGRIQESKIQRIGELGNRKIG